MSQVKIYGLHSHLKPIQQQVSQTIHQCITQVLGLPQDKRAHRFFYLQPDDFFMPDGRSDAYTIIEIYMIAGRTTQTKKNLIKALFAAFEQQLNIQPMDVEIMIIESPAENWGFRGFCGDEVTLNYKIDV